MDALKEKGHSALSVFVVIFIFFPYIKIIPVDTDINAFWLLISAVFLLLNFDKIRIRIDFLLFIIFTFFVLLIYADFSFTSFRGFFSLLSFSIALIVGYNIKINESVLIKIILISLVIYILCGLIQLYIDKDIFTWLLSREKGYGTIGGRGVESLTAEPTFLAWVSLSMLLLCYLIPSLSYRNAAIVASLFLLIFISRSASGIATLIIVLGFVSFVSATRILVYRFSIQKRVFHVLIFVMLLSSVFLILRDNAPLNYRVVTLFIEFATADDFFNVLARFQSVNDRLYSIYAPIYLSVDDYLIPHGFNSYYDHLRSNSHTQNLIAAGSAGRVMSFVGSLVYEMGFLGLFILIAFFYNLYKVFVVKLQSKLLALALSIGVFVALLQAVPLSLPILPFTVGYFLKRNILTRTAF